MCQLAEVAAKGRRAPAALCRHAGHSGAVHHHERIAALRAASGLEIEIHAHDDLGLATANTLVACRGGATHANTTVNGLGERAGNAPLEEVVLGLAAARHRHRGGFKAFSGAVAAGGDGVRAHGVLAKSLVGQGVFTHEAGIHVDGLLKHPDNYQGFDPSEVGSSHRIVPGKHSGPRAVMTVYAGLGVLLTRPWRVPAGAGARLCGQRASARRKPELLNLLSDEEMARHV